MYVSQKVRYNHPTPDTHPHTLSSETSESDFGARVVWGEVPKLTAAGSMVFMCHRIQALPRLMHLFLDTQPPGVCRIVNQFSTCRPRLSPAPKTFLHQELPNSKQENF